ncbi:uncharacterized protein VICG_01238 [Vittaforma corneae ATCC 50505]|uniref:Thioredoxin domain-containing protein n=1 Tax=Vittaforma corneae (strain ATCC 50505) TaxID=993615 RepID=L2GM74_VITCO|nr:uncharacterized protein VICG_01238 [Vittaforma corneae ATCC 50505]ELA41734.1 hypothetical protein VICG_01238 [Vittaforma corneae ATCC 50505]
MVRMPRTNNDSSDFDDSDDEFMKTYTKNLMKRLSNFQEYTDEEELIDLTTERKIIVHFYSPAFKKCQKMNEALKQVSVKFPSLNFGCINVEKCPKMCASLKIKVLPFLAFFKDGFFVDEIVGFEKFGNCNILKIEMLEEYIKESEMCRNTGINSN